MYNIIYETIYDDHHVVIKKRKHHKKFSLVNYKLLIDGINIEFYINDISFVSMWKSNVANNNNGQWLSTYKKILDIPKKVLLSYEHIIYQDLYKADNDLPKVVYIGESKTYYMMHNHWFAFKIEVPKVFVKHFPQYKWMTKQ